MIDTQTVSSADTALVKYKIKWTQKATTALFNLKHVGKMQLGPVSENDWWQVYFKNPFNIQHPPPCELLGGELSGYKGGVVL